MIKNPKVRKMKMLKNLKVRKMKMIKNLSVRKVKTKNYPKNRKMLKTC